MAVCYRVTIQANTSPTKKCGIDFLKGKRSHKKTYNVCTNNKFISVFIHTFFYMDDVIVIH